jgi:TolB protein
MDWDGANLQQLTTHKNAAVSPSWSRDGRYIAYSAYNYHTKIRMRNLDLFIYDLKTSQRMLLSGQRGTNSTASFFPDQKNAVIRISPNSGTSDLYKVALDGSARKKALTNGPRGAMNVEPAVSPDGNQLAFSSDRSGKAMIYIQDLNTGVTQRLTYAGYYNSSPAWSPDGKRIAFAGGNEKHFDIYVMDTDGKNLQKLTSAQKPNGKGANNEDPSFSPDGRFILFRSDRTGNYQLYVVSVDGKHEYRLTFDQNNYYRPQWSPYLN